MYLDSDLAIKSGKSVQLFVLVQDFSIPCAYDSTKVVASGTGSVVMVINGDVWVHDSSIKEDTFTNPGGTNFTKAAMAADFVYANSNIFKSTALCSKTL